MSAIGSIYAMERIAKNSAADRNAILFLLGAFVRIHSPWPAPPPTGRSTPPRPFMLTYPLVLPVVVPTSRLPWTLGLPPPLWEEPAISLSRIPLRSVALRDSRLNGFRFRYANLARSGHRAGHGWNTPT